MTNPPTFQIQFQVKAVEAETIDILVESLLRAPTSMGNNSWEFVVVTDTERLDKLSRVKPHGASFLKNAPHPGDALACERVSVNIYGAPYPRRR